VDKVSKFILINSNSLLPHLNQENGGNPEDSSQLKREYQGDDD
jgi:hypothetical protein